MRILLFIFLFTQVALATPQKSEVVKIGFIAPLTGPFVQWGESLRRGAEIAIKDTDNKIELDFQDSSCSPRQTVTAAQKLFLIDNVRLIVGPGCLSGLKAIAPIATKNNALIFSTGLLDDETIEKHESVFNFATQISAEARALVEYLARIKLPSIALVHGTNAFGEEFGRVLPIYFKANKIRVVANEALSLDSTDYRGVIARVMRLKPGALFLHQGEAQTVIFMKQLRAQGYSIPVYSQYAIETDATLTGGSAVEGMHYTYPYNSSRESKERASFLRRYREAYGEKAQPSASSYYVYDGLMLLDKAITQCGGDDSECIGSHFRSLGLYKGISGDMTFLENGGTLRPYGIKKIYKGEFYWIIRKIDVQSTKNT